MLENHDILKAQSDHLSRDAFMKQFINIPMAHLQQLFLFSRKTRYGNWEGRGKLLN